MTEPAQARFVLLLEADPVIGLDLADALEAEGHLVAGPIRSVAEARDWLVRWTLDLAVLGLPTGEGTGPGLARSLRQRGVPFLVHGVPSSGERAATFADAPVLTRPAWYRDVVEAITRLAADADRPEPHPC